jgi:hypothetical protein
MMQRPNRIATAKFKYLYGNALYFRCIIHGQLRGRATKDGMRPWRTLTYPEFRIHIGHFRLSFPMSEAVRPKPRIA